MENLKTIFQFHLSSTSSNTKAVNRFVITQNSPKNDYFLPPDTRTYESVSEDKR